MLIFIVDALLSEVDVCHHVFKVKIEVLKYSAHINKSSEDSAAYTC